MRVMYVLDDEACRESMANTRMSVEEPQTVFVHMTREEALQLATGSLLAELDLKVALQSLLGV